jgi:hypothetical protein
MGRLIFRKEKYENDMIRVYGAAEYLLIKLNSSFNDAWPDVLDGKDITDDASAVERESETVLSVAWKREYFSSGESRLNCFIKPSWCDLID